MKMRENYQRQTEAKLKEWTSAIKQLRAKLDHTQIEREHSIQPQLEELTRKQEIAERKLAELKQASDETWMDHKPAVDEAMARLQLVMSRVKEEIHKAGEAGLSWAKGLADEHLLKSIGWAEGFAEEDPVESVGWGEGLAEKTEAKTESKGWAEGYDEAVKKP